MMELENLVLAYNLQFFAKDGPGGEKTEPATSKKLDDVRKEGQVAKSKELISAVSLLALFVLIKVYIGIVGEKLLKVFQDFYNTFDKIISSSATGLPMNLSLEAVKQMLISIVLIAAPFLIVAVIIAFLLNVLQQKWMVTAKPLQPKASKISPLSGFKRIFSVKQLVELLKAIAMMAVIGIVAYQTIKDSIVERREENGLSLGRILKCVGASSVCTLLVGVAFGFLGTNVTIVLIMVVCLTVLMVVFGMYTGYRFGFEQKTKAYSIGGVLLIIGGIDVVIRYIVH